MGNFQPISWDEALAKLAESLAKGKGTEVVTGEVTGSSEAVLGLLRESAKAKHTVWDALQPVGLVEAAEAVYGVKGIPQYSFEKADVVLNFGADFVETWISPVEFARGWATARRADRPVKTIHVEPRMSLTGANADLWLASSPGTEVRIALAVLKGVVDRVGLGSVDESLKSYIRGLIDQVDVAQVADETGVAYNKLASAIQQVRDAKSPLVIAGGTVASVETAAALHVVVNLINLVSGAVGKTVQLSGLRKASSSLSDIKGLVDRLNKDEVGVLLITGTNPAFTVPADLGFRFAARKARTVVTLSSHLDETAALADIILPIHTPLESWGIAVPRAGVYALQQPAMSPVFNTKDLIEVVASICKMLGAAQNSDLDAGPSGYVKATWRRLAQEWNQGATGGQFEKFWISSLEKGGYFIEAMAEPSAATTTSNLPSKFPSTKIGDHRSSHDDLVVYPFPSIKSFDGRAANRPWLQELPDPMTTAVWDTWVEVHPKTAKEHGLAQGDYISIKNFYGEVHSSVYLSDQVVPGIVAVPLGQGHRSYGRYARMVGEGTVVDLVSAKESTHVQLLSARAAIRPNPERRKFVTLSGSESQEGREIARTKYLTAAGAPVVEHGDKGHGGEHHEPKQMYDQREHPLYRWGLSVDLSSCTGCSACVVACYAENNIPVVGKELCSQGREMSWLRIERYIDRDKESEEFTVNFLPMMCQHCGNAPCEPVCPVFATYHNEEGLNAMVYNRCVGTRYCSNNCSYKVRRFNWVDITFPEPLTWQLNPDVTKRSMGVMEKCTFCVQRIVEAKDHAKDEGRLVRDGEIQPACVQGCPTEALVFGNLNDPNSKVSKLHHDARAYKVLDHHINTQPAISYLEDVKYRL
jgi:molybdopterin-containing oxidoreductase family iron-sulfur binding subunit